MISPRYQIRCHDYIDHRYATVRDALVNDAAGIFRRATREATTRANQLGAQLRIRLGAIELAADVAIRVIGVDETITAGQSVTTLELEWHSMHDRALLPTMKGTLSISAMSPTETQLELVGAYDPPLGFVGRALDAIALHRIAEASVLQFVRDVARFLRAELPREPGPGDTYWLDAVD